MPGIEDSPYPLVYRVDPESCPLDSRGAAASKIRTYARALTGMQKEAVVHYGPTGEIWRVLCDEGPWLNGTDLAPFPLGHFTAGLAATFLTDYLAEALARMTPITALEIEQHNFFTMEGSAIKGTMTASADPVQVRFVAQGDAPVTELAEIGRVAVRERSLANVLLRDSLPSVFAIVVNGERINIASDGPDVLPSHEDPGNLFNLCTPDDSHDHGNEILRKLADDDNDDGNSDGAAVGLQASQKRRVHIATRGHVRADGLKEIVVQCIQPRGSRFMFLSDESRDRGGQGRAPNGITWLSCGVAFCFMTQIGRYANIAKQDLEDYRIVQDTGFTAANGAAPSATPVKTLVFLDTNESIEASEKLVQMGEQTCYLHAAYSSSNETQVS